MIQQNITIFLGVKTRLYYTWKTRKFLLHNEKEYLKL